MTARRVKGSPEVETLRDMLEEVAKESDRGAALIVSAWVDDSLAELLRSRLVDDQEIADTLLIGANAPLGTFSAREKMAFALGLIGRELMEDLKIIRDIRNEFAHWRVELTFQDQSIVSRCENLKSVAVHQQFASVGFANARDIYLTVALLIVGYFILLTDKKKRPSLQRDDGAWGVYLKKFAEKSTARMLKEVLGDEEEDATE